MTYAHVIESVVRTVGNAQKCGTVYETPADIRSVIAAVDCGLCQLVPNEHHPFQLHDAHWNISLGIELTSLGKQYLGIDERLYHRL